MTILANPCPGRLRGHPVSGTAAGLVDRLDSDDRAQRFDGGTEAFGEGEVVLDQGVLRTHPAADHAVAALGATCACRACAVEVRVGHPLAGRSEEDADGRL